MTSARTARVTVEVEFTISARATEGEMVDQVHAAIRDMHDPLAGTGAHTERRVLSTHVIPVGEPGGSL